MPQDAAADMLPLDISDIADADGGTPGDTGSCMNPPADATQPDGAPLPNLTVLPERLTARAEVVYQNFRTASCDVAEEHCVAAPGCRRLLRFDLWVANVGDGDLYLGPPNPANRQPPLFEFSPCHNHYHLIGFAEFTLLDAAGQRVGFGHKQSFCLEDLERLPSGPDIPATRQYVCSNQGIHSGWADIYDRSLDCQYVDVTDVPPGHYRLQVRINVLCHILESDYSDNVAEVDVTIPPGNDAGCPPPNVLGPCTMDSNPQLDRDCGWSMAGSFSCTPGTSVTLGCDPYCAPALGSCTGDTMIRVCPGIQPCTSDVAIASNDDNTACHPDGGADLCSRVTFTCPASGNYSVLSGPYQPGSAFQCTVAVSP